MSVFLAYVGNNDHPLTNEIRKHFDAYLLDPQSPGLMVIESDKSGGQLLQELKAVAGGKAITFFVATIDQIGYVTGSVGEAGFKKLDQEADRKDRASSARPRQHPAYGGTLTEPPTIG